MICSIAVEQSLAQLRWPLEKNTENISAESWNWPAKFVQSKTRRISSRDNDYSRKESIGRARASMRWAMAVRVEK